MKDSPFSAYDFFGYLGTGFVVSAAVDYARGGAILYGKSPNLVLTVFLLIVVYAVGHIVATPAAWLYERVIMFGIFGSPTKALLTSNQHGVRKLLLPGYYRALPTPMINTITEIAKQEGYPDLDEGLFLHAYNHVREQPITKERLATFLNLYGFARNLSFACLLASMILAVSAVWGKSVDRFWILAALLGTIGLFYRYVKFFRLYAKEVFLAYSNVRRT